MEGIIPGDATLPSYSTIHPRVYRIQWNQSEKHRIDHFYENDRL